jgi:hypothetical protein
MVSSKAIVAVKNLAISVLFNAKIVLFNKKHPVCTAKCIFSAMFFAVSIFITTFTPVYDTTLFYHIADCAGASLPALNLAAVAQQLPIYAHLLGLRHRGAEGSWSYYRAMANNQTHSKMQSVGRAWLRPCSSSPLVQKQGQ